MLKSFYLTLIVLNAVMCLNAAIPVPHNDADNAVPISDKCATNSLEESIYCRGSRAIRNVIHNLNKSDKPLVIVRGLEIVRSKDFGGNATENRSDATSENTANAYDDNDTFVGRFSEYLRSHELNIKFSDLLAEESERFTARDLERNGVKIGTATDDDSNANVEEGRKKDKGQGLLMAMALMFGKMMAVMGLGGIGALAMKALGVAMMALMMAGLVGLKTLAQHGGGHETSHSVQYLTADGHHHKRRRRSLEFIEKFYDNKKSKTNVDLSPYRAWRQRFHNSKN